jgi:hypothetical protein
MGLLLTAGVALSILAVSSSAVVAQSWTDVLPPDARFRIEMPAPVDRGIVEEKETGLAGPRTVYQASQGRHNFDLDHVDYLPDHIGRKDRKAMVLDLGRGVVEKQFPKAKYRYARDEAVTLQGWDGYALDIEDEKGDGVMMRTYLVKNRLYRLLVTYDADPATKAAAARFVESFKVADER